MNITEDYCSFEVAKLLKEKGFDGEIHTTFDEEGYTRITELSGYKSYEEAVEEALKYYLENMLTFKIKEES